MVVLGRDDDKCISIGNDLIGLLEDLGCLGLVLVEVVGLFQEGKFDLIRVCIPNQVQLSELLMIIIGKQIPYTF